MNLFAYSPQKGAKVAKAFPARFSPARSGLVQRKCACGGTPGPSGECAECRQKRLLGDRSLPGSRGKLSRNNPTAAHRSYKGIAPCDTDKGVVVPRVVEEHCAGDCVAQHEAQHAEDYEYCCTRYGRCLHRGESIDARNACRAAWDQYMNRITDWTECNAYEREHRCLSKLLIDQCSTGSKEVGEGCCKSLQTEFEFVEKQIHRHCPDAVQWACPFDESGEIIKI